MMIMIMMCIIKSKKGIGWIGLFEMVYNIYKRVDSWMNWDYYKYIILIRKIGRRDVGGKRKTKHDAVS